MPKDECWTPCVLPNTLIITNPAVAPISDLQFGDLVLTDRGRFREVTQKFVRNYKGNLARIKTRYYTTPFLLTPEHPVRMISAGGRLYWNPAEDVEHGERVAFPIITKIKDEKGTTPLLMRLAGYYLAEGDCRITPRHSQTRFSFNRKEVEYVEDVKRIFKRLGYVKTPYGFHSMQEYNDAMALHKQGLGDRKIGRKLGVSRHTVRNWIYRGEKPKVKSKKAGPCERITVHSRKWAEFFNQFGTKAPEKRLPSWVLFLPFNKQAELVKGYWRGDGNPAKDVFAMVTSSVMLAHQIRMLLLRLRVIASIVMTNPRETTIDGRRIVPSQPHYYQIRVGGKSLARFSEIVGYNHPFLNQRSSTYHFGRIINNYFACPVSYNEIVPYRGQVMNLEVEEDQTYTLANMTVHNCDTDALMDGNVKVIQNGVPIKIDVKKRLRKRLALTIAV